jgi:hypothetical protein
MKLESYETEQENLLMAKKDLAVLRDLFHTLNDAGISFSSLNSSIALLEEYIDKTDTDSIITNPFIYSGSEKPQARSYQMWRKSNTIFARHAV